MKPKCSVNQAMAIIFIHIWHSAKKNGPCAVFISRSFKFIIFVVCNHKFFVAFQMEIFVCVGNRTIAMSCKGAKGEQDEKKMEMNRNISKSKHSAKLLLNTLRNKPNIFGQVIPTTVFQEQEMEIKMIELQQHQQQ